MDNYLIFKNNRNDELYYNDIINALEKGAADLGYTDLMELKTKGSSADFSICCGYVGRYINDLKLLWLNPKDKNTGGLNKQYILLLSDIYINLSFIYDKRICLEYFLSFIGASGCYMQYETVRLYENDPVLSNLFPLLRKKMADADNALQLAKARDSKQSIMNLAYNNYAHNWSGQIKENEVQTVVKTLDDIKRERLEKSTVRAQIAENNDV